VEACVFVLFDDANYTRFRGRLNCYRRNFGYWGEIIRKSVTFLKNMPIFQNRWGKDQSAPSKPLAQSGHSISQMPLFF
jgi:hypothetical protein